MLIRNAQIYGHPPPPADVRLTAGKVAAIGRLDTAPGETVIDAGGGLLIPGLHDHHLHLFAMAAAMASVPCGPPHVHDMAGLIRALADHPGQGWLRGTGYHDHVAGEIDRRWIDRHGPPRPVRIQHRSGRRWIVNSAGLALLLQHQPPSSRLDMDRGMIEDDDAWMRDALAGQPPDLTAISRQLASFGVTGVTDLTPSNDASAMALLAAQQCGGALLQRVHVAGGRALPWDRVGDVVPFATKIHLHDAHLPEFDTLCRDIAVSHRGGRPVAVHCVTRAELVFTLAAFADAGTIAGDRIEHASVATDDMIEQMAALRLHIVTQPNFVAERGDAYLRDVDPDDRPLLYRCQSLFDAGIVVAGGTDAPFGRPDPWAAMAAAVDRRTADGHPLAPEEAISPEQALSLFLAEPANLSRARRIAPGAPADLCLLTHPWDHVRTHLNAGLVRLTIRAGTSIFDAVDQSPL